MAILFSFPLAGRSYIELPKTNCISISVFGFEDKEKYPIYMSKKYFEEKHDDFLWIGKKEKGTMFLSKILIHSCMIIVEEWKKTIFEENYIVEENTFL